MSSPSGAAPHDTRLTREEALALFQLWHGRPLPAPSQLAGIRSLPSPLESDPDRPGLHSLPAPAFLSGAGRPGPFRGASGALPELGPTMRKRGALVPVCSATREAVDRLFGGRARPAPYS